jgi:uncharacterized protein (TIGR02284 family)
LGAEPAGEPTLSEAVRRGWLNFRASMTIEEDRTTRQVLSAARERTADLRMAYNQALERPQPDAVRSLLASQCAEIQDMHAQIRDLDAQFETDGPDKIP